MENISYLYSTQFSQFLCVIFLLLNRPTNGSFDFENCLICFTADNPALCKASAFFFSFRSGKKHAEQEVEDHRLRQQSLETSDEGEELSNQQDNGGRTATIEK
ncbi:UNVERIFIED_CONTAM: hypothetical protein K2H54_038737 [Gekko kuhli]